MPREVGFRSGLISNDGGEGEGGVISAAEGVGSAVKGDSDSLFSQGIASGLSVAEEGSAFNC